MKNLYMYTITILFILQMALAANIAIAGLTGQNPAKKLIQIVQDQTKNQPTTVVYGQCTDMKALKNLSSYPENTYLKALDAYQMACNSFVTKDWMIFTDMPKDANVAKESAKAIAKTIKEFNQAGVSPMVIIEPVSEWGLIDFEEFKSGFYDDWIKTYFATLKAEGITDEMMGTWVPFPEANLPYWNHANTAPADFAALVNKYLKILKSQFPNAKTGILLNSATYETDDFDWANGEYISLLPYVKDIEDGLVTTFGLQGFPWAPSKGSSANPIFNAAVFLNYSIAEEAATELGVKNIWLNTGTFKSKYTLDDTKTIEIQASTRADVLNGILEEAEKLKKAGFNVTINLFAEDKSQTTEATDWSYEITDVTNTSTHKAILLSFIKDVYTKGMSLSIYDVR